MPEITNALPLDVLLLVPNPLSIIQIIYGVFSLRMPTMTLDTGKLHEQRKKMTPSVFIPIS